MNARSSGELSHAMLSAPDSRHVPWQRPLSACKWSRDTRCAWHVAQELPALMRKHPNRLLQWGEAGACQCLQARVCGGGGRAKWRRQGGLWLYGHGGQGTGTARYVFEAAVLLVCTCPLV